jgi:hypothetical protein
MQKDSRIPLILVTLNSNYGIFSFTKKLLIGVVIHKNKVYRFGAKSAGFTSEIVQPLYFIK